MSALDKYKDYAFKFEMNEPGVLELIFDGPNLNAVDARVHSDIPYVWNTIDEDPDVNVVIVRGAGKAFSAGGDFALIDAQIEDYGTLTQVLRESRDLYYNMIDCSKPIRRKRCAAYAWRPPTSISPPSTRSLSSCHEPGAWPFSYCSAMCVDVKQ